MANPTPRRQGLVPGCEFWLSGCSDRGPRQEDAKPFQSSGRHEMQVSLVRSRGWWFPSVQPSESPDYEAAPIFGQIEHVRRVPFFPVPRATHYHRCCCYCSFFERCLKKQQFVSLSKHLMVAPFVFNFWNSKAKRSYFQYSDDYSDDATVIHYLIDRPGLQQNRWPWVNGQKTPQNLGVEQKQLNPKKNYPIPWDSAWLRTRFPECAILHHSSSL